MGRMNLTTFQVIGIKTLCSFVRYCVKDDFHIVKTLKFGDIVMGRNAGFSRLVCLL